MNQNLNKNSYLDRSVDFCLIWISWITAYFVKFELGVGGVYTSSSYLQKYLGYGVLLSLTSVIVFKNSKLYENIGLSFSKEILNIVKVNAFSFTIFLVLSFFSSEERLSRVVLGFYFTSSTILLICAKIYFRNRIQNNPARIVLIGDGKAAIDYYERIHNSAQYKIIDWFHSPKDQSSLSSGKNFSISQLEKVGCDGVIVGFDNKNADLTTNYLRALSNSLIPIMILPDISFAKLGFTLSNFRGIPVVHINEPNIKTSGLLIKRVFDFLSCGIGMICISPLLILICILVKLSSRGPIFYSQVRMGIDGREFKMWKFRSMIVGGANNEGWTVKNDPRVTKIGSFLRKSSLDELPQLWNVVVGDMSLVGPRPERPVYVNQFRDEIPSYMLRHKFKAGITGWAQINGWRGDTSIEKRIECDLWYIKNWSLTLDFSIVFLTFWKGFINKNAY